MKARCGRDPKPGQGTTFVLRLRRLECRERWEPLLPTQQNRLHKLRVDPGAATRRPPRGQEEAAWLTFWSATTNAPSAKCSTSPCAARATASKPCNPDQAAKNKIDGALYDVIITDIKMPNIDGIEVLRHAHHVSPDSAVILITAVDDYEAAVEAVKAGGATDYIRKSPGLVDEIKLAINRALEKLSPQQAELCPAPRRRRPQLARQHHRLQRGAWRS